MLKANKRGYYTVADFLSSAFRIIFSKGFISIKEKKLLFAI